MIEEIINASLILRKVKMIECEEAEGVEEIRPQMHVALIAPFGSGKNKHILNTLKKTLGKDYIPVGYPTKASVLGTITKTGEYNPAALVEGAGKVIGINEFSEANDDARAALLEPMEDGMMVKDLGYHVRTPIKIRKKYVKGNISGGKIRINQIWFTCIAGMMYWPSRLYERTSKGEIISANQKGMGLLSRFLPIPVEPTFNEILDMLGGYNVKLFGKGKLKFDSFAPQIDKIIVKRRTYMKFYDRFKTEALAIESEFVRGEFGLLGRILNDLLRLQIARELRKKKAVIDGQLSVKFDTKGLFFRTFFDFFRLRRLNFTELKVLSYISVHPNHSYKTIARSVDLSRRHVIRVCRNLSIKLGKEGSDI